MISQQLGKKDIQKAQESVKQLIWVVTAVAVGITAIAIVFRGMVFAVWYLRET